MLLLIYCVGQYVNDLSASVFVYVQTVIRSPAELYTSIGSFMEFWFHTNVPCLANLAQTLIAWLSFTSKWWRCVAWKWLIFPDGAFNNTCSMFSLYMKCWSYLHWKIPVNVFSKPGNMSMKYHHRRVAVALEHLFTLSKWQHH